MRASARLVGTVVALGIAATAFSSAAAGAAPMPQPPGLLPVLPAPPGFLSPTTVASMPPALGWLTAAKTAGGSVSAKRGALEQLVAAHAKVRRLRKVVGALNAQLTEARRSIRAERDQISGLDRAHAKVLAHERDRAVRAYIGGQGAVLFSDLIAASSINDQARRAIYANAGQTVDAQMIREIEVDREREATLLDALRNKAQRIDQALGEANDRLTYAFQNLQVLTAAADNASRGGRVFPVDGPFEFVDSWGAFRADVAIDTRTHGHDATDIMAANGTPVVAIEAGTLDRVGWNALGGWRLWIKGRSGTNYYYAHLSAYAPNLMGGVPVVAGQYLGRVGNSGNASGGPTHLHIEVHIPRSAAVTPAPGEVALPRSDGMVVNPYPFLCLLAGAPVPVIPPPDPLPPSDPTTTSTVPARPNKP